jgi:mycothiol system anti-sigma-R factor
MECFDCVTAAARLHLYIDHELNDEEIEIVQQHLVLCPHCECRFHFDSHLKKLIHERCTIVRAPSHLREAVMKLARGESSYVDSEIAEHLHKDLRDC